ncbi:MAG: hypothetical protein DMG82_27210 [Acidobacteria bacterium]|nr:MAG: hypothetical protein DMG82_27210 [Acidobacteriota bacterium]
MCGRYRLSRRKQIIEEYFGSAPWDEDWNPRFNIAPTQPVPVIRQHAMEPVRHFALMKGGRQRRNHEISLQQSFERCSLRIYKRSYAKESEQNRLRCKPP